MFHKERHPKDMGESEVVRFISFLATEKNAAASTQNQASNAIGFLYKQVLHIELGDFGHIERVRKPERLPTVMAKTGVDQVLASMSGMYQLMAKLLYGRGLCLMECVRLRVKDIDLEQNQIIVREENGMEDRSTMLPVQLKSALLEHLDGVKIMHEQDIKEGLGEVYLPLALDSKYPNNDKRGHLSQHQRG